MDTRRHSGSYSSRVAQPSQPLSDAYSQKRSSYRRPIDAKPTPTQIAQPSQNVAPGTLDAVASNSARPVAAAPVANGASRTSSHRRRQSQQIASASPDPLPAAPDVPRGPPPTSYRDPYAPKSSSRTSRSYSGRRDPTLYTNASRQQPNIQIAPDRLRSPPYAPAEPQSGTIEGAMGDSRTRRPSVPDRSPLQKLEGKLDDISKEEKRARMLEMELAAQEKAEAEMRARRALQAAAAAKQQQRNVSGPVPGSSRSVNKGRGPLSDRRHVSMPSQATQKSPVVDSDVSEVGYDVSEPWDPSGAALPAQSRQQDRLSKAESVGRTSSIKGKETIGIARGSGSFRDRSGATRGLDDAEQKAQRVERKPVPVPTGLGLYGVDDAPHPSKLSGTSISRHDSKRLSKDLPPAPRGLMSGNDRKRDSRGIAAAQMEMEQQRLDQKNALNGVDRALPPQPPRAAVSPPVTATRRGVGFAASVPEAHSEASQETQHHHHLPDVFSPHHEPDRRYVAPPMLEEWKNAPVATLVAEDLDLEQPEVPDSTNKAWWEESTSTRRRRSGGYSQPSYDGNVEEPSSQTTFNPPLYLKCGPLLRYTGIRRDKSRPGKEREIWRGSVMIVTVDGQSSYQKPPTLRLFKQPMDLLPPPPAEIDAEGQPLHPAYIDPLEGQIKVSRSGKTLYAKPVDEIPENVDLSRVEDDTGLFQETRAISGATGSSPHKSSRIRRRDGEKIGKVREVPGVRLHAERGVTFWRFNLEIELAATQVRVAYKINRGPAIGFWIPAKGETMNIMFHSCNGFSLSVDPKDFCGPDPLWRDVLNNHQTRPFHVMIGGGDQIYNDAAMRDTTLFRQWTESRNPLQKHSTGFSSELQNELEQFYLDRYSMWFSQGLFGMANSQIPMINIWDDHDIIDGYGSYPHHFMSTPVFTGLGAVAFKYYMLFQHQSVPAETEKTEPSWLLGAHPGPYIKEQSRNVFMSLGKHVAFLGLDCRTERRRNEIMTEDSYDIIFDRLEEQIIKGETKHLIVLLGVPIAYPRLNFLENILTSRLMDPIKALGRAGMLGNFVNKFDGGVEILDDLDDHWTAKHHKDERNWFVRELQHIASTKSVRVTILGGDVHLAAAGQFYSNKKKFTVAKDRDHRYMPNVISSAIVNTPPGDMLADVLNKRNKIHHLDPSTDEDMIPLFTHDVDGKTRNNTHLLPRRNWCSLREYKPGTTPPSTPSPPPSPGADGLSLTRTLSDYTPGKMVRRMSGNGRKGRERGPPVSYYNNPAYGAADEQRAGVQSSFSPEREERPRSRRNSLTSFFRRRASVDSINPPGSSQSMPAGRNRDSFHGDGRFSTERPSPFHRRASILKPGGGLKQGDYINLEGGLDICLNLEVSQKDPAGITTPYRLLVPALDYTAPPVAVEEKGRRKSRIGGIFSGFGGRHRSTVGDDGYSQSGSSIHSNRSSQDLREVDDEEKARQRYKVGPRILIPGFGSKKRDSMSPGHANSSGATDRRASQDQYALGPAAGTRGSVGPVAGDRVEMKDTNRHVSAPTTSYNATPALSAPVQHQSLPNRSGSTRNPTYNSSHKSQLPAPVPADPEPKVHRRSMGGILNQHRGERFEHDAHVLTHTNSNRQEKRKSYPPHPAIVGAGPGSPYSRGTVEPRNDSGGGYFASGARSGPGGLSNAGVGAKYLGGGRYAGETDSDEDDEDDDDRTEEDRYTADNVSQPSFEPPKPKPRWKIWQK